MLHILCNYIDTARLSISFSLERENLLIIVEVKPTLLIKAVHVHISDHRVISAADSRISINHQHEVLVNLLG